MKRFSPKQTLSNFVTAVRETVDSVNMKSVAMIAIVATVSLIADTAVTVTPAEQARMTEEAKARVAAEEAARREGTRTQADRDAEAKQRQTDLDRLRPLRDQACEASAKDPTNRSLEYKCDDLSGQIDDLSPGGARRAEQRARERDQKQLTCEKASAEIAKLDDLAKESCGKAGFGGKLDTCFDEIRRCNDAERDLGSLDEEDEGGADLYCNKILANKCPAIPSLNLGSDYRQDKRDAERDRKDAKKTVDELMKDQREQQLEIAQKQRELVDQQEGDAAKLRDAERELGNELKDALQGVDEKEKAAFKSAQDAYKAMEVEYIKMRKEARDAADLVVQAKDDLQVMCRASAEKKYIEAEKVRQAALAARKKNLGASTNVSGSSKRTKAALARARQVDFVAFFNECSSGASADGVGGNNRIKTAERAKASAEKLLTDKAALIETERTQMLEKLKSMEQESTNEKSKIVEQMNQKLTRLSEAQERMAKQNARAIADLQQQQSTRSQSIQQALQTANQELMETEKEAYLAVSRSACAGRNSQRSESSRNRIEEGFSRGEDAINAVARSCKHTADYLKCSPLPPICNAANAVVEEKDLKDPTKSRRKLPSLDVDSRR